MLYESELKIMDLLWTNGNTYASELAKLAFDAYAWNKNTTYTIINKLIEKNYVQRTDPKFFCTALVDRDQEQTEATQSLIDRLYKGSAATFFSHFANKKKLNQTDIEKIKKIIEESED
jgi:BlaI family penicillinase repressor